MRAYSELGVLGYLLIYIRESIFATLRHPAEVLATLSERYCAAATELGLRHVPNIFCDKHGSISSTHYRTLAEVVEVITSDIFEEDEPITAVIRATVSWYWACRALNFTQADLTALEDATAAMGAAWTALDTPAFRALLRRKRETPKRRVTLVPKFHRALTHVVDYIRRWGPLEYITTETSEAMHKPLKIMFRT